MPAALQVGVHARLPRRQPQLGQPRDLGLHQWGRRDVGQGRSTPQRQGLAQQLGLPGSQRRPALLGVHVEHVAVHVPVPELQPVPLRPGHQQPPVGIPEHPTLATTTLLRLRDRGVVASFAGAALQFGTYDLSGLTPAGRLIADEYFIRAYAGHVTDRTAPDISPVYGDLRGLPPLLMVVGGLDVLLQDNMAMAARVSAAGGEVDLRIYPESRHGFTSRSTGMAKAALHDIECWLADRFSASSA